MGWEGPAAPAAGEVLHKAELPCTVKKPASIGETWCHQVWTCHIQSADDDTLNSDRVGNREERGQCLSLAECIATAGSPLTALTFIPRYTHAPLERGSKNNFQATVRPCSSLHLGVASLQSQLPNNTWIFPIHGRADLAMARRTHVRLSWHKSHCAPTVGTGGQQAARDPRQDCGFWSLLYPKDGQGYPCVLTQ